jgi:hypothetical protein
MLAVALFLAALAAPPPPAREHFRDEATPAHVLRITDLPTGDVVRIDGADSTLASALPLGETARMLLALAGLERAQLDPDVRLRCDSTCWAKGTHGEPDLTEALAWSCDSWVSSAWGAVGHGAFAEVARGLGLDGGGGLDERSRVTAKQWTDFWTAASRGSLDVQPSTLSVLMRAAGLAVSSPRGAARGLYHRAHRVVAIVGSSEEGTWVTGTIHRRSDIRWTFALFLPGGSPGLAATRTADLLLETARTYERATAERGGRPLSPLDER